MHTAVHYSNAVLTLSGSDRQHIRTKMSIVLFCMFIDYDTQRYKIILIRFKKNINKKQKQKIQTEENTLKV